MKKIISLFLLGIIIIGLTGCGIFSREDKAGQEYYNTLKKEVGEYQIATDNFNKELSKKSKNAEKIADNLINESEDIINIDTPKAYVNVQKYYKDIATYSKQMGENYKKYIKEKDDLKKIGYMENIKEISMKRDKVVVKLQKLQKNTSKEIK